MQLKEIRLAEDGMFAGQRGSRMSKWIQSSESARTKLGLRVPERVQCLCLYCAHMRAQNITKHHKTMLHYQLEGSQCLCVVY